MISWQFIHNESIWKLFFKKGIQLDLYFFPLFFWVIKYIHIKLDHRALQLSLNNPPVTTQRTKSRFCFESIWLDDPNRRNIIQEAWITPSHSGDVSFVPENIKNSERSLSKWHQHRFGGFKHKLQRMQNAPFMLRIAHETVLHCIIRMFWTVRRF